MADFTYSNWLTGATSVVEEVTSVEFAPAHVVFRNGRRIILAELNERVHELRQVGDAPLAEPPPDRSWVDSPTPRLPDPGRGR